MAVKSANLSLELWIEQLLGKGRYSFALEELKAAFPQQSDTAIKFALLRLSDKGKTLSIHKSYYVIIPPQYHSRGVLPPALYMDAFMRYLRRPYYMALLSAAVYHGAAHQQPQEFFVATNFPVLRPTRKKGLRVNYISKKEIPDALIEPKKTEAGYLKVSNAVLTASDLIQFDKRIGGVNRALEVLHELVEVIRPQDFTDEFIRYVPVTVLQRLGYLLEIVSVDHTLADALYDAMMKGDLQPFRIPLKPSAKVKGFSSGNRWKVIENIEIEADY